ncbi:MAG: GrpB family protein [Bacteroides sp.]|nr:GrpB family protein [Bacillota bacterium]MCM1455374.1 GrpB family protein [Bacteroides sp.]
MKPLSEMTLQELWDLFPISLSEHKSCWADWYADEAALLKNILPFDCVCHHVGSTAVKDIMAKPIIDILIEFNSVEELSSVANILENAGYIVMATTNGRISLNKGYTSAGFAERVFHLHLRLSGDADEVYFKDFLNAHPDAAREYEKLKLKLAKEYERNRDAYTEAKGDFVKKYTQIAKQKSI